MELPYRGTFGQPRPAGLGQLPLPPRPMPSHIGGRPLKSWRYVGVYGRELMLCVGAVRIGPARQAFWAVWDRRECRLRERTALGRGPITMAAGNVRVRDAAVQLELDFAEGAGIEVVSPAGGAYAWTRKQLVQARGRIMVDGRPHRFQAPAIIDDTAAYYPRHTRWSWSAGVGTSAQGQPVAWNLVSGVNDAPTNSERTTWIDGEPHEAPPSAFAADLSAVDELRFAAEATRRRDENLLLVRSSYRQPFGTFSGALPGGVRLAEGFGVMEFHDVFW